MAYPGVSGSLNYQANSGSVADSNLYVSYISSSDFPVRGVQRGGWKEHVSKYYENFQKPPTTTTITITESLTIKYFQRVYDAGLSVYCYYTKTSIDATPSADETTPNYTGAISDHSIVKILEIY